VIQLSNTGTYKNNNTDFFRFQTGNMKVYFVDIILLILFVQLLLLAIFLIFERKKEGISNKILAGFLCAKALCISNMLSFRLSGTMLEYFPHSFYFGSSFTILWGPALYFYTKSLTDKTFQFKWKDSFHLIPFLIHFIYLTFTFHIYSADTKRALITSGNVFSPEMSIVIQGFIHMSILFYTIASIIVIRIYRIEINNIFSSLDSINLSWMIFVLAGFSAKWIFDVWYYINVDYFHTSAFIPLLLSRLLLFLFINIMLFKGLRQPAIFTGVEKIQPEKKRFLSKATEEEYITKLSIYMENEKPYLVPDITLLDLSRKVSIPHRSLSEIINNILGKNFYDFINSYRIKESQRLLKDQSVKGKTVLEVLYEVGYNSKSSFNTAFKKHTGMTPTEFKKSSQN